MQYGIVVVIAALWSGAAGFQSCTKKFDLVFVVEDTAALRDQNAEYAVKDFLTAIVNRMKVDVDNNVQIGLQFYNDDSSAIFYLNDYQETTDVMAAILLQSFSKKSLQDPPNLKNALAFTLSQMLSTEHGERPGSAAVQILLSYTGEHDANAKKEIVSASRKLQNTGSGVITIGIGPDRSADVLIEAATGGLSNYFDFQDFDDLHDQEKINSIVDRICNYVPTGDYFPCEMQAITADLVFVVDMSESMNTEFAQSTINFMTNILEPYEFGKSGVQASLVTYSINADIPIGFTTTKSLDQFIDKVTTQFHNGQYGGDRYVQTALEAVFHHVLTEKAGYRPNAAHSVYVISGGSFNGPDPVPLANLIRTNKSADIHMIALGKRQGFWKADLDIAGDMEHFYNIKENSDFILANHLPQMIWRNLCIWNKTNGLEKHLPAPACPRPPPPAPPAPQPEPLVSPSVTNGTEAPFLTNVTASHAPDFPSANATDPVSNITDAPAPGPDKTTPEAPLVQTTAAPVVTSAVPVPRTTAAPKRPAKPTKQPVTKPKPHVTPSVKLLERLQRKRKSSVAL